MMKKIDNNIKKILKTGEKQNINENKMFEEQPLTGFINNEFKNLEYQEKVQANCYHLEYPLKEGYTDLRYKLY